MRSLCSTARRCTLATEGSGSGEPGQFEIMGRKQGVGTDAAGEVDGTGPGQRQAVVSAGAAADFVHQYQAVRGGVVQNIGGFRHFDHERRAAARQVVAGSDTGKNPVDRTDHRRLGRNPASCMRQQDDQGGLAHVGRLAAHVGPGDDQHPGLVIELYVVGRERFLLDLFDHRVAATPDVQAVLCGQFRLHQVQPVRPVRKKRTTRQALRALRPSPAGDPTRPGEATNNSL